MPRSRALLTAPLVLAIVLVGVFAIRSRDGGNDNVQTTSDRDCSPVARADAVATQPATPIAIDVLANDTDADGDPLVFQILKTTGGDATVDDGGTPTDASDDRVLFTPADPAPESAEINYQAVDPNGSIGEAVVTVVVNAEGVLPLGTRSASITDDPATGECGTGVPRSTTTAGFATNTSSPPYTGSVTATTVKAGTKSTSGKKKSGSGGDGGGTSSRTTVIGSPNTPTSRPSTNTTEPRTTTTKAPTTTQPSGPTTTQPDPTTSCGPYPTSGSQEARDAWEECVRQNANP